MSTKQRLTNEQEQLRLEGLRRLARIIARQILAQRQAAGDDPRVAGDSTRKDGAA